MNYSPAMSKKNKKGGLHAFISSQKGQRFFNFAYSIGAAIVIWGALFKILHLPGGNTLLSIGMGTEVLMFLLTAFDRPPKEYNWERVYPGLIDKEEEEEESAASLTDETEVDGQSAEADGNADLAGADIAGSGATAGVRGGVGGGTIIIGGNGNAGATVNLPAGARVGENGEILPATAATATGDYTAEVASLADEMRRLHESTAELNRVSETLLDSYKAITENSSDISNTSRGYVDQLSDLNRNIQGLNTIYEIQLKSISSQLDSIDRVNRGIKDIRDMYEKSAEQSARYCEETEKMARYMQQLNKVYEKMIHAMTVNPMMGGIPPQTPDQD